MAYNKIPLALAYDDNTGNASGLVEFTLGLSDAGDVCDTAPEQGQALVFSGTEWCPSTLPAPGEFTGNLSDVGQVCSAAPTNGQVLTWSATAGEWCPSTVATGGGGVTSVNGSTGVVVLTTANINEVTNLYYTDARVTANGSVAANTGKLTANAINVAAAGALMEGTANLGDLANVSENGATEGTPLVFRAGSPAGSWGPQGEGEGLFFYGSESVSAVSGSYTVSNVVTVPPGNTGKGDTTADSFIFFSGTDASSTEFVGTRWGANWVEGPQNIATTNGNYLAYVSATTAGDGGSGVAAVAMNAQALAFMSTGDHGGLNGLADNDHPQYQTSAAAQAALNLKANSSQVLPLSGGTITGDLTVVGQGSFGGNIAVSGAAVDLSSAITIPTVNTVDNDGSIETSLAVQRIPHVHGQFIWTKFNTAGTQSTAAALTTLGNGITTASDIEIVKSIPAGAPVGDNSLMSYTFADLDGGTAKWNVGDSQGIYKITLNAIVSNSTSNPDTDINIKVNGIAVGGASGLFITAGSWIAHQARPITFEWVGLVEDSWDITVDATSNFGNTNFLAGTTVTITRIA